MKENRIAALPLGKNLTDSCAVECQFITDTFLLDEKKNPVYNCFSYIIFSDFGSWVSLVELNLGTNQLSRLPGNDLFLFFALK